MLRADHIISYNLINDLLCLQKDFGVFEKVVVAEG